MKLVSLAALAFGICMLRGAAAGAAPYAPDAQVDPYNTLQWQVGDHGDWYEWWYYKVVVPGTADAFYLVYGVVNPGDAEEAASGSRAQLGFGSFADRTVIDGRFPVASFAASRTETFVRIGDDEATDKALKGRLVDADGGVVTWDLTLVKDWSFDAMGWAGRVRDLSDIYWYPAQASAEMSGTIDYKGRRVVLDHAPAYQDRNWGRAFPEWWTWLVSNDFTDSPGTVLAAGGGVTRIVVGEHQAMGIGLLYEGETYAFRASEGAQIDADIAFGTWHVTATSLDGYRIEISADAPRQSFLDIPFHAPDGAVFHDYEALRGNITVKLYARELPAGWRQIADLRTTTGGIEYGSPEPQGGGVDPGRVRRSLHVAGVASSSP
jgi:tocopherol cyclase